MPCQGVRSQVSTAYILGPTSILVSSPVGGKSADSSLKFAVVDVDLAVRQGCPLHPRIPSVVTPTHVRSGSVVTGSASNTVRGRRWRRWQQACVCFICQCPYLRLGFGHRCGRTRRTREDHVGFVVSNCLGSRDMKEAHQGSG